MLWPISHLPLPFESTHPESLSKSHSPHQYPRSPHGPHLNSTRPPSTWIASWHSQKRHSRRAVALHCLPSRRAMGRLCRLVRAGPGVRAVACGNAAAGASEMCGDTGGQEACLCWIVNEARLSILGVTGGGGGGTALDGASGARPAAPRSSAA